MRIVLTAVLAANIFAPMGVATAQAGETTAVLTRYGAASAPQGFAGVCSSYPWACSSSSAGSVTGASAMLSLASAVNTQVNGSVRAVSDMAQYGQTERWVLPASGKGDCEDYALMKKKRLIERGVPANRLRLALVMSSYLPEPHIVLVMRADGADYVLDNRSSAIRRWSQTGYTFVKMQAANKGRWDAVLLGPNATRSAKSRVAAQTAPQRPADSGSAGGVSSRSFLDTRR